MSSSVQELALFLESSLGKDFVQKYLQESKLQCFLRYEALLLEWNHIHNLGGHLDARRVRSYLAESIYPLNFIAPFSSCMDVGSGAGFPALALAMLKEEAVFDLVEPHSKRAAFLQMLCAHLNLKNIRVHRLRVEELRLESQVQLITSRALMKTNSLIALTRDFLCDEGAFLFYKGSRLGEEIDESIHAFYSFNQRIYFYRCKKDLK